MVTIVVYRNGSSRQKKKRKKKSTIDLSNSTEKHGYEGVEFTDRGHIHLRPMTRPFAGSGRYKLQDISCY